MKALFEGGPMHGWEVNSKAAPATIQLNRVLGTDLFGTTGQYRNADERRGSKHVFVWEQFEVEDDGHDTE